MRILLCCPVPLVRTLGAGKHHVELAQALREIGQDVDLVGPEAYALSEERHPGLHHRRRYAIGLRDYLLERAASFDVVDYDHGYLPFGREEFPQEPLFVARSVLLAHHLENVQFPRPRTPRLIVGELFRGRSRRQEQRQAVADSKRTVREADLINVLNQYDRRELIRAGVRSDRIVVLPLGLSDARLRALAPASFEPPATPTVAFVGTFDYRKGARDFPALVEGVKQVVPSARFRLLGAAGMFKTARDVLAHFPRRLRDDIDVVPTYAPDDLPGLLAGCSVGVFPSYLEGFGFGVLEMLAAGLPVIAYDVPGPPEVLPPPYLVPPGDVEAMGRKVATLVTDARRLQDDREWARQRASTFTWQRAARLTVEAYASRTKKRETSAALER